MRLTSVFDENHPLPKHLLPDKNGFAADPFGYSTLAWQRWGLALTAAGFDVDPQRAPSSVDLKNPILWLCQANALTEAATLVLLADPDFKAMPRIARGICHSQYFAVGLMLMGYSLEVCLKAMIILRIGVDAFIAEEKKHRHHRLDRLAEFMPNLDAKEMATLRGLSYFVVWAGRYPDPGSGREAESEHIFELSEGHQIAAKDVVALATKVMGHVSSMTA